MLPDSLGDTYKYYKANTTEALTWLGTTEKARNKRPSVFQQGLKQTRLKGKARKLAKETAPAPASEKHILALADIVPLARSIVSHGQHTVQVPPRIIGILQKAISARRQCTAWFLSHVDNDLVTDTSNEGHAYFTSILQEVLSLLQPFCPRESSGTPVKTKAGKHKDEAPRTSRENTFRYLEIEDPYVDEDAEADKSPEPAGKENTPTGGASIEPKVVYEVETDNGDVRFALFCLLRDLYVLRQHIHHTWRKYAVHETSLIEASAITNTAVEFVRRIEEDFLATYTQFFDWEDVMQNMFPVAMTQKKNFYLHYCKSEHLKLLKSFYFLPFQLLVAYRDSRGDGKLPFLDDNYDPRSDHFGQSEQQQWRREMILLMEVFREFLALIMNDCIITEDELIRGLREVLQTKKVLLWVVFALQAFVDIRNTLGEKVNRGLGELQDTGTQVKKMIDWYCHHSHELNEHRIPHQDQALERLSDSIDKWVLNDIFEDLKEQTFKDGRSSVNSGRPFLLLSEHPWLCGLFKCALRMKIQQAGFQQLDLQGIVVATTQLYYAVQHGERVNLPWPDLDTLVRFHSKSPFLGSVAKTPVAAYQRLLLSHGASVVMFAKKRRTNKSVRARAGQPIIFVQSPLILALYRRFCKTDVEDIVVVDDLERLLSERILKHTKSKSARNNSTRSNGFSPVRLLAELEAAIAEEEEALYFDCFDLHRQCCQVLRSIERLIHKSFRSWSTHEDRTDNEVLHLIPQFILDFFTEQDPILSIQGRHMFKQAAETIQGFLEQQEAQANEAYKGMISEKEEDEYVSELSPATLWGILDHVPTKDGRPMERHATRNGKCIHIGVCSLQFSKADMECVRVTR